MRKYVFVAIGGILGAISRYLIKEIPIYNYHGNIPLNTLIINITGSFTLALILTTAFEIWEFDADIRLGIATGFLGAYTTFSTFCKETVGLIHEGYNFSAFFYLAASTLIGLAAAFLGIILARGVVSKLVNKDKDELDGNAAVMEVEVE
jgi:fluoride exporter